MNKEEIKEIINNLQRVADRKCYPEDILDGSIAQEWVDYITNLQEENERLLKIAKKMHTYIFLHSSNEQEVYDELGLTKEENNMLGYSGQIILKGDE